jgi:uncharacterized protein DUF998
MAGMSVPRLLALAGMVAVAVTVVLIGALHVLPASAAISPYRRTISEYALTEHGTIFNLAVLVLVAGSVSIMLALIGAGVVTARSGGMLALLAWTVALAAIVYFPKHNWAVGPSATGTVHRFASVVAFLSLPVAALLTARAWRRHPRWRGHAGWTFGLGLWSLLCFSPIVGAIVAQPWTGVRWWRAIPLGAVERLLLFSEICVVLGLAVWAARAGKAERTPVSRQGGGLSQQH